MSSHRGSLESGVLWCPQDLDLSLMPLVFSLILTVTSRLLHLYSTDDKTSRLKMKSFSTVRDTREVHRVTWRREEEGGSRGVQEEKRGNQKRREQASQ